MSSSQHPPRPCALRQPRTARIDRADATVRRSSQSSGSNSAASQAIRTGWPPSGKAVITGPRFRRRSAGSTSSRCRGRAVSQRRGRSRQHVAPRNSQPHHDHRRARTHAQTRLCLGPRELHGLLSGGILTTRQASPQRSSVQITQPPGSISRLRRPWKPRTERRGGCYARTRRRKARRATRRCVTRRAGESPPSPVVADRVDRPGHVVKEQDANRAAPHEAGEEAVPAADPEPTDEARDRNDSRTIGTNNPAITRGRYLRSGPWHSGSGLRWRRRRTASRCARARDP